MNNIKPLPPFKRWTLENFPFIEADFDAITNYQLYCKIVEYLKSIAENQNSLDEAMNYVLNYFNNLDVQEEIDNKLDEMVEDGTLQEIISVYLNSNTIFGFDTVSDLKSSTNLLNGSYARTIGYYSANDGGGALYQIFEDEPNSGYYEILDNGLYAKLVIENKTINSLQFGIKSDNSSDDFTNLQKMLNFINNYNDYLIVIFDGSDTMKFSDTLHFNKSNLKIILNTDLQLTKTTNISTNNSLKAIQIGTDNNRLDNIIIEGNNHYIDGNGSNVTLNNSTTSGLYQAKTLQILGIDNLKINNLVVKNGYKDCCTVTDCSCGEINNCEFIGSYRDNGFGVGSSGIENPLPVYVNNCVARNCRDLGFSTWYGKNVIYNNCYAYNCGNTGNTSYDNTYTSAGGGFSSETPTSTTEEQGNLSTTFNNCIADSCKNYGFYFNTKNIIINNCEIKNIVSTGTTALRSGAGIVGEDLIGNGLIKNCNLYLDSIKNGIICTGYLESDEYIPLSNIIIDNCNFYGNVSNAIILNDKVKKMKIINSDLSNCTSSLYGIRFIGQSNTYQNRYFLYINIYFLLLLFL